MAGGVSTGGTYEFALARYNTDGTLDTTFGDGGKVTTNFGVDDLGFSAAIQGDGRILVAGVSVAAGGDDFTLARYLAGEPAPTPTPTPVPGVGWPGLLVLAAAMVALALESSARRGRAGPPS